MSKVVLRGRAEPPASGCRKRRRGAGHVAPQDLGQPGAQAPNMDALRISPPFVVCGAQAVAFSGT
eukprot:3261762-Alexandrium_andersonii.AAC.1